VSHPIIVLAFLHVCAMAEEIKIEESEFQTAGMRKLAEGHVLLHRVHKVIGDNFPEITDAATASALIQTHESRVSHHHVMKLRDAHGILRTMADGAGSLSQDGVGSLSQMISPGRWFDDFFGTNLFGGFPASNKVLGNKKHETAGHTAEEAAAHGAAIRMTNLRDSQYVGPLKVGSQGDILSVVYDTGSTNLWFASTLCKEGPCMRRRRYDPYSSDTYKEGDYDLRVTFGTGELSGQQGIDDVEMGGFKVKQQTFAMIQLEKGSVFDELDFEGILGLAFPSMSANGVPPFFDQVINQKLLQKNAVSFYFTKLPTDASAVFFGDVDPNLYVGKLDSVPVSEEYYWMADLKDFQIGGKSFAGPKKVVFDSGTTYYTAPKSLLKSVVAQMPQSSCEAIRTGTSKVPEMTWILAGHNDEDIKLTIKPSDYYVSSGTDGLCDPAWMPIEVPSPHGPAWIFGEAFMRTYFTSFHRGDGQSQRSSIKIAPQNPHAIGLVQQLHKDQGMSTNQKRLSSAFQIASETPKASLSQGKSFLGGSSMLQQSQLEPRAFRPHAR